MNNRLTALALVAAFGIVGPLRAQTDDKQQSSPSRPPPQHVGRGNPGRANGQPPFTPEQMKLQRQIQQAFRAKVRDEVGLTDEQMQKLRPIVQKYDRQRWAVNQQDRTTRLAMATELGKPQPDEAKIQQYSELERSIAKQRFDINDARQRDLGTVMTPVQVAKFRSLEEKLNQEMAQMRRNTSEAPVSDGKAKGPPKP